MKDPKLIICLGILFFAIALTDYLLHIPDTIYHWFSFLKWWGKISVIGFCSCLVWLFVSKLIKK